MDSKKIRKSIGRFAGWVGLSFCSFTAKFIPQRFIYGFATGLASCGYFFARKPRKIAIESLTIAFGNEKTKAEIERIAKDCFISMAKSGVEIVSLLDKHELLKKRVKINGKENLDRALAKGKGVILVSAHFGNFPLMMAYLGLSGYKIWGIMRHMRDHRVEKIFAKKRAECQIGTIYSQPRRACVEQTLRCLRNNELVFIPIDQNFGTGGVFVNFFGKKAATATGPVVLVKRTQSAIVPCFIIRQKDNSYEIIFEPALELKEGKTPEESVVINIQQLTDIIEAYIRKYPTEWGWIHRRWKSRPS